MDIELKEDGDIFLIKSADIITLPFPLSLSYSPAGRQNIWGIFISMVYIYVYIWVANTGYKYYGYTIQCNNIHIYLPSISRQQTLSLCPEPAYVCGPMCIQRLLTQLDPELCFKVVYYVALLNKIKEMSNIRSFTFAIFCPQFYSYKKFSWQHFLLGFPFLCQFLFIVLNNASIQNFVSSGLC